MPTDRSYHYEAMFLIGQATAADLGSVINHIDELLNRAGAKLIAMAKWDERRLAYEIDKQKRGLYIIAYFEAPASKMAQFDRDCQLSETIMRVLTTRADHLTLEEMQAADGRDALLSEAKLRADRASEADEQGQDNTVRMGRPIEDTPLDHASDGEGDDEDTSDESQTESANA